MEQVQAALDWLVANWPALSLMVLPFLATFLAKIGRVGVLFLSILEAAKDGTITKDEKAQIFDDAVAIMRGWLPNRSKESA